MGADQEVEQVTADLNNFPPNMTGGSVFQVSVSQESTYSFTVKDEGDSFTVTIDAAEETLEGALLESNGAGEYTFTWILNSASAAVPVAFQANDSSGAASMLSPQIQVCACSNGGMCTLDGVITTNVSVVIMNCDCTEAYTGEFCEADRDGCSEIQCFEGVECVDVPAPGVGAICGPCPSGFTGNGEKCSDINECVDPDLCEQLCVNTVGSYECSCEEGYRLIDEAECDDINECAGVNDCQQLCTNTEGSFTCSCQTGFNLAADGKNCEVKEACSNDSNICSHICAVVNGEEQCFCPTGLQLDLMNDKTCIDVDECVQFGPCDQTCVNTLGSFECGCMDGYQLEEDLRSCEDFDECLEAARTGLEICPVSALCVNSLGSFDCSCIRGYKLLNGTCFRCLLSCPEGYTVTEDCSICIAPESGGSSSDDTPLIVAGAGGADAVIAVLIFAAIITAIVVALAKKK